MAAGQDQALRAEPSIAALLPCNVVVRSVGETTTTVEAFDPAMMTSALAAVAALERQS